MSTTEWGVSSSCIALPICGLQISHLHRHLQFLSVTASKVQLLTCIPMSSSASLHLIHCGLSVYLWTSSIMAAKLRFSFTQLQPPTASARLLYHPLQVDVLTHSSISVGTSPHSFDHSLHVHSHALPNPESTCISELTVSQPQCAPLSSHDILL